MKTSSCSSMLLLALACFACLACGNPRGNGAQQQGAPSGAGPAASGLAGGGELVRPPFEVTGDAQGLLLVWYDERGDVHLANQRSEIPEARRASVRVDALELAPEQRLDPAFVYVADLR